MAPPTRLRPHLNELLQKNLELEHEVADLRHQLTQSTAKWADERKTLATGCDALMASFAKFRARLDVQVSDWGDSEGEVEQNLDAGVQVEETGEGENGDLETEGDQGSSAPVDLHERYRSLAGELQVKEEELEESRRKREAAEEELRRVERALQVQSEQLEAALASARANTDISSKPTPAHTPVDTISGQGQSNPGKTELETTREKLDGATQETARLKQLLQQWQKYGSDWKRDAQSARARISELERREVETNGKLKEGEDSNALLDKEKSEVQRLLSALAEQTIATEFQRTARQDAVKRIHDLEAMITRLRNRLTPEQLALFDSEQDQIPEAQPISRPPPVTIALPPAETTPQKRTELIVLKIPSRPPKKPVSDNRELGPREEQPNRITASNRLIPVNQTVQLSETTLPPPGSTEYEVCIHTCNKTLCRNGDRSILWPRKQSSLPRHALSAKKHRRCNGDCPGNRLLVMSTADATKEPRRARCRPPSDEELALAAEEGKIARRSESEGTKGAQGEAEGEGGAEGEGEGEAEAAIEGENGHESSAEPEDHEGTEELEEPEEGSTRDEGSQEKADEYPSSQKSDDGTTLGKRLRSRYTDGDEALRARKLRPRTSFKQ